MSRLEKFIEDHRDAFDEAVPSDKIWDKIGAGIPTKKATTSKLLPLLKWSAAAALILLAGTGVFFLLQRSKPLQEPIAVNQDTTAIDLAAIDPEAAPEVNQFAKLIALKQEELKVLSKEQPELYHKFSTDINQLDSSYRGLKTRLAQAPNKELLIEAMVQNLQLQLNVLNQQLHIIHQIKQSKKYSHDKNNLFM